MTPPLPLLLALAAAIRQGHEAARHVGAGFLWVAWLDGDHILVSVGLRRFQPRIESVRYALAELDEEGRTAILDACDERLSRAFGAA
jgi:hypothetical protein